MFLDEIMLEDAKEEVVEETQEMHFCEGVDGLFEVALESEMSWNNIVVGTIKEEFVAIKNESTVLMEEAKTNWFKQIIEWVKDKAAKVAAFFKNLYGRFVSQFTNIDKFLKENQTHIMNGGKVEVEMHSWKKAGMVAEGNRIISQLMAYAKSAKNARSVDEICKEVLQCSPKDLSKKVTDGVKGELKTQTINGSTALTNLKALKGQVNKLNDTKKANDEILGKIKRDAEAGMNKSGADSVQLKGQITLAKNVNSLTDKVTAITISLLNSCIAEYVYACRKLASAGKKSGKAKKESAGLFELI